jgi:hypothetical protein
MGGNIITQSTEEKDLGITIDEKLKFKFHINNQTTGKSLIYIVNSMGSRTLPWGIPLVTSVHFELDPLSTTFCLRSAIRSF